MEPLNLPHYPVKVKKRSEKHFDIFDVIRRKWFQLTPEEWVRQHWIHHLQTHYGVPQGLISCETGHRHGARSKRTDLLAWKNGKVLLLIECKAPNISIGEKTLDQALVYQKEHQAHYLLLTNGKDHFCFQTDLNSGQLSPISKLPFFDSW